MKHRHIKVGSLSNKTILKHQVPNYKVRNKDKTYIFMKLQNRKIVAPGNHQLPFVKHLEQTTEHATNLITIMPLT